MMNRVILVGRLVADPDLRYTPAGIPVANFRIAVDRPFKNAAGERDTDFFNVVAWRGSAEFAANYLGKGRLVGIDGRLQLRQWETPEGQKRSTVDVVAEQVQALDRARNGEGGEEDMPPTGDEENQ